MTKAVIFDMDGVLSDSEWIYVEKILELLREEGVSVSALEINDLFGKSMIYICSELIRRYNLPGTASDYADRVHEMRNSYIEEHGLYPMEGAPELVRALHEMGVTIAVASSGAYETIRGNLIRFGIDDCIDHIVSGLDCKNGKPDPEIFLRAAALLGRTPDECIVFEDSANGVTAAKRAGMYCYAFVPPKAVPQDVSPADFILTSFVGV